MFCFWKQVTYQKITQPGDKIRIVLTINIYTITGGDETELSDVPSLAGYMQLSELDWKYQTAAPPDQAYCQAMNGDRCNWPRGKVLGGKKKF